MVNSLSNISPNLYIPEKEETGEAPRFIQPLKPKIVEETSEATLECTVSGHPTPVIKWYKGNQEIVPDDVRKLSYIPETGTATYSILKPTSEDETVYRVKAVNKFGVAECRANLIVSKAVEVTQPIVLRAPVITKPVKAVTALSDKDIVLEAEFEGTPVPEITWFRNGKEIKPNDSYEIKTEDKKTVLRIKKTVNKKQKHGKYEVRATNPKGEARSSGSVNIVEQTIDAQAPQFIETIKPQRATVGEVVILEAVADAIPEATFQWFHESVPLESTPEVKIVTEGNKSTLLISEVKPELAGQITCRAENAVGSVTCTTTLNITEETEWEETQEIEYPRFVKCASPVRVMDGETVKLTCIVTGKPIPKVSWYHNDMPVQEAKDVVISQNLEGVCTLAISEVFPENAGEYTCRAANKVGEAICKTSLMVESYEYIPDSELGHFTGSEEDLLADKVRLPCILYFVYLHPHNDQRFLFHF